MTSQNTTSYKWQCSVTAQDCPSLYVVGPTVPSLPFTHKSCVRDIRLPGTVGRCGFPGAACMSDSTGKHNCASVYPGLCAYGVCGGAAGAKCKNVDNCNWGLFCNNTGDPSTSVCGGADAQVNDDEASTGLDYAKDYCLSGVTYRDTNGTLRCTGGPNLILPPAPTSSGPSYFDPTEKSGSDTTTNLLIGLLVPIFVIAFIGGFGRWAWLIVHKGAHQPQQNAAPDLKPLDDGVDGMEKGSLDKELDGAYTVVDVEALDGKWVAQPDSLESRKVHRDGAERPGRGAVQRSVDVESGSGAGAAGDGVVSGGDEAEEVDQMKQLRLAEKSRRGVIQSDGDVERGSGSGTTSRGGAAASVVSNGDEVEEVDRRKQLRLMQREAERTLKEIKRQRELLDAV